MSIKYYRLAKDEELPDEFCVVRDVGGEPSEYVFYVPVDEAHEREISMAAQLLADAEKDRDFNYDWRLFKAKREMLGMTQQEFADKCRLGQPTISNIERGRYSKQRGTHTCLLVGLVLDALAYEQGKMEEIYQIELSSQKKD